MSELLQDHEKHESIGTEHNETLTTARKPERSAAEKDPRQAAIEARTVIAETAAVENPLQRLERAENDAKPAQPTHINRELKQLTLRHELQQIRRRLPAPQRVLSKVIHQPIIRVVSEGAGKTVSRPSGLLGGGLVALVGTSGYLYLAKHVGFRYNYGVFLLLFAGGFIIGLLLEFLVYLATTSRRNAND